MPLEQKPDREQEGLQTLRTTLEDVLSVLKALSPTCHSVDEVTGVVELGLSNDGQLRLIVQSLQLVKKSR